MRAVNHALTGAVIGLMVEEPLIALPASLLSHYACDVLPHYGSGIDREHDIRSRRFHYLLYADAALCLLLVMLLALRRPRHWLLAAVCAFVATLPDFASLGQYLRITRAKKSWKPGRYVAFATGIQWFERPIGAAVETAWFAAGIVILAPYLLR